MSRTSTAPRSPARVLERLVARRRATLSRQELGAVLAGMHGQGVRADVLAAMKRQPPDATAAEPTSRTRILCT